MLSELGASVLRLLNYEESSSCPPAEAKSLGIDVGAVLQAAKTHLVMGRPLADPWEAVRGGDRHAQDGRPSRFLWQGRRRSSVRGL